MEIRQLRYFVSTVELGSLGKAARVLELATSTLSQQISHLESELATCLLQRTRTGVTPTDAGIAFFRHAQLALRNIDAAAAAARCARLSGQVNVGLAPTTASVMGLPLVIAMRERYPNIRFHLVESLSGHLTAMLNTRQLDLAILFSARGARRWSVTPLLEESLYLIAARGFPGLPDGAEVPLSRLAHLPLALPTHTHGLRSVLSSAAESQAISLNVALEIDSLPTLMRAVGAGLVATVQPGAAIRSSQEANLVAARLSDARLTRRNLLVSLPEEELSLAGLACRGVIREVAHELRQSGAWAGTTSLQES